MNRTMKNLLLVALFSVASIAGLSAQKFGYTNSAAILVDLPETQAADEQLAAFQEDQQTRYDERANAFNEAYTTYMQKAQAGELNRLEMEEREAELQKQQRELQVFDQELTVELQEKREELYSPILNKVQSAIDEVGQEGNYTMIFDVSVMNLILFAEESEDLTETIKAKL